MAVVAVIITAPLGAILTNTLGVIWLNDDSGEVDEMKKSFGNHPPGESLKEMGELKLQKKNTIEFGTSTGGLGVPGYTPKTKGQIYEDSADMENGDMDESPVAHTNTENKLAVLPGSILKDKTSINGNISPKAAMKAGVTVGVDAGVGPDTKDPQS